MNTNESLWDITQRYLKSEGIEITSWNDPGGYFIFESEKPLSVIHFKVNGCRGWDFGLWINGCNGSAIQYFMQHDDWRNKFKPNQGCLDGEIKYENVDKEITYDESMCYPEGDDWEHGFYGMLQSIVFVKRCPYAAYVMGGMSDFRSVRRPILMEYISTRWCLFKHNLVERHLRYIFPSIKAWLYAVWVYVTVKDVCGFKVYNDDKLNGGLSFPPMFRVYLVYRRHKDEKDDYMYFKRVYDIAPVGPFFIYLHHVDENMDEFPDEFYDRWDVENEKSVDTDDEND